MVKKTGFKLIDEISIDARPKIHELYQALITDEDRNTSIVSDIVQAVEAKRSPIVLTERQEHLYHMSELLQPQVKNIIVIKGGMGKNQRQHVQNLLAGVADGKPRVILSTGRYIGEGFDDHQLDTLFLTLSISWRGTLAHQLPLCRNVLQIWGKITFLT